MPLPSQLRAWWERLSLRLRITTLLLAGLLVVQAASILTSMADRNRLAQRIAVFHQVQRAADVIQMLDGIPRTHREAAARSLRYPVVFLGAPALASTSDQVPEARAVVEAVFKRRFGERPIEVSSQPGLLKRLRNEAGQLGTHITIQTQLRDGQRLRAEIEVVRVGMVADVLLWPFIAIAIATALLVFVAVRLAMRPLERLAEAATSGGADGDLQPIAEEGPPEVRRAAQALNAMRSRLRAYLAARVHALAAISHDLRTPITRLRLRSELLADTTQRAAFVHDLSELGTMVQTTLDYLSGTNAATTSEPIDVDGLLASVIENIESDGPMVPVSGRGGVVVRGDAMALRRALTNLLHNAVQHARNPSVHVEADELNARLRIEDRGPGIPENELTRVTQPYYRLESSRSRDTGGVGLGLSIATDIAHRHGGNLELTNRDGGGLTAVLSLPRA